MIAETGTDRAAARQPPTPDYPQAVYVEATNECNLSCIMCPVPQMTRTKGQLAEQTLRHIVRGLPTGTPVGLSDWGEPLRHRNIVGLVSLLADNGYPPEFVTNATLLTGPIARSLIDAGLSRVYVSVDGIGAAYEKIRKYPFDQLVARVEELLALRPPSLKVFVRITFQEANEADYLRVKERFAGRVDGISVQRRLIWAARPRQDLCPYIFRSIYFFWDGTAIPCCVDYLGELALGRADAEHSAVDLWRSAAFETLRQRHRTSNFPAFCSTCNEWAGGDDSVGFRFQDHDPWHV